ncbi:hypothetical protein ACIQNU_04220 [Streptomyces sp. NPDC091292]|uniref:hypothetical protein n=1 Tax=Streptomyces sp. NPDC091292 TaxID=3365991 RepID=UPI00380B3FF9
MRALAAVASLKAADAALALHSTALKAAGITAETPMYRRLNSAVARADANPHLPDRYRDPRDITDDQHTD